MVLLPLIFCSPCSLWSGQSATQCPPADLLQCWHCSHKCATVCPTTSPTLSNDGEIMERWAPVSYLEFEKPWHLTLHLWDPFCLQRTILVTFWLEYQGAAHNKNCINWQNCNDSLLSHLQQHVQLIFGHHHSQPVTRVNHKDDALTVSVVMLPQVSVPSLPRHVKGCESNIAICRYRSWITAQSFKVWSKQHQKHAGLTSIGCSRSWILWFGRVILC